MGYETWRDINFPSGGEDGENDDPDTDDRTNRDEFDAGTDPNNSNDVFRTQISFSGAIKDLSMSTKSSRIYSLERSTNLLDSAWQPLFENVEGTDSDVSVADTNAYPEAFYRSRATRP